MSNISVGIENQNLYIIVTGRGTAEYCPELNACLQEILLNITIDNVYFDTHNACYIDSSFIGTILAIRKKLSLQKDRVFLLNPNEKIIDIFHLMGLDSFIPFLFDKDSYSGNTLLIINKKIEKTIADIKLLLDAHRNIMETSAENYKRFTLVESAFQKELEQKQYK